ncbi:glycosyltransferase family 4 protein [Mangrovimonas sp. TPBH4]|uniref:glycosyltransferase family 4 protein n=1 Tax=Mangrovimonas sp. TPBH4 TaxID=1645914 RepID=UPI0006B4240A|nr:glycosyltransferase family 4 protein [Mangrovimonas sp. TPBH4]
MKLAIISHTEHYTAENGNIVGWGPTVTEINHLLEVFEEIWHVAMWHEGEAPKSALPYDSPNIHFVAIPAVGGLGLSVKLVILLQAPKTLNVIRRILKEVDCFQFRAPTGIGSYVVPYLSWYSRKPGWFKYAGNWNQAQPPLGYRWQRWLLQQQSRTVTINGHWPEQPKHCLSFENPCLTLTEVEAGRLRCAQRVLPERWTFCYVGRIESAKGVGRILEAFGSLSADVQREITAVHLVGEGAALEEYRVLSDTIDVPIVWHGSLAREQVFDIYKQSDVFLMPTTASEGFPKVIAEAMNFGCLPMVSQVSAISQYVQHERQGWVLDTVSISNIQKAIGEVMELTAATYQGYIEEAHKLAGPFTYAHYNQRVRDISAGFKI